MTEFTKMHGLGNDFVVLMPSHDDTSTLAALARQLCDRHTGIGADGLLAVLPSTQHALRMRVFNADGSESAMCGNGIRCVARFAHDRRLVQGERFVVATAAGPKEVGLRLQDGQVTGVSIEMGIANFNEAEIPMRSTASGLGLLTVTAGVQPLQLHAVKVGVPHVVTFVDDLATTDVVALGAEIEHTPAFPEGTNVNFVQVMDSQQLRVRTWERGAGATLASGSGACAAAVIACREGLVGRQVRVLLALGALDIEWPADGRLRMTGPADYVCEGRML